jgi:hypothetical protein
LLNQSTQRSVAISTADTLGQDRCRQITSALQRPLIVSAKALSWLSPTLPTDGTRWTPRRTGCFRPDGGAKGLIAVFGA